MHRDEYGLQRQATGSSSDTLLRGASFMSSVQHARQQHRQRLAAAARGGLAANPANPTPTLASLPASSSASRAVTPLPRGVSMTAAVPAPMTREPTMLHSNDGPLVPSPAPGKVYTVVLDLDETVIYGREGELMARAHLKELLRGIADVCEVIVWTAGERSYAKGVVREINTEGIIRHLVYRDDAWFNEEDYTKDLRQLGRDMDHVLIVENTPDCVRENPANGIIVSDYEGKSDGTPRKDATLLKLRDVIRAMAASGEPVPKFLASCKMLRRQTVETEGREIPIFFLSSKLKKSTAADDPPLAEGEGKVVKTNRDKAAAARAGEAKRSEMSKSDARRVLPTTTAGKRRASKNHT